MAHRPQAPVAPAEVVALIPAIRRYLSSANVPSQDVDDLVQETVTRLLEARGRLEQATLGAYAIVTTANLVRSARRARDVEKRHRHRLHDADPWDEPGVGLLRVEEHAAMRRALDALPERLSAELLEHHVEGSTSSSRAIQARVARSRAALRVAYVVALRRVPPPQPRCHAVLIALSAHDRRRQAELGAGRHLLRCPVCQQLANPLLQRNRALAGLVPLPAVVAAAARLTRAHPVRAAVAGGGTAAAAGVAAVLLTSSGSPPMALPAVRSHPDALCALARHAPTATVGTSLVAEDVTVSGVPADEGFVVRTCDGLTVRVHIVTRGESAVVVRPGSCVSFTGVVTSRMRSRVAVRGAAVTTRPDHECPSAA